MDSLTIGGPEDFTENLEKYMRGEKGDIEDFSLGPPDDESTPSSRRGSDTKMRVLNDSAIPLATKQTQTKMSVEEAAEDMFDKLCALHAEVEQMRQEEEVRLARQLNLERENAEFKSQHQSDQQKIQELEQRQANTDEQRDSKSSIEDNFKREIIRANENSKNLAQQLQNEKIKANNIQAEFDAFREDSLEEFARLEDEVREQTQKAEVESNKSLVIAREAAKLAECKEQNEQTIERMQDRAHEMNQELDQLQETLDETRRIVKDVEDENDRLSEINNAQTQELKTTKAELQTKRAETNSGQHRELKAIHAELQTKKTELTAAHKTIAELRETQAQGQQHDTDAYAEALENLSEEHESAIAALKAQHSKETETLRSLVQKTARARQNSVAELKKSYNDDTRKLQQQVAKLEQELRDQQESSTHSVEDELRSAIRVLSNKLSKANNATKAARAETEEARQYAASIEEANNAVNAELEARLMDKMEAREQEWHRRAQLLFKERDRMGKALLHAWGREEMGPAKKGEKQAYRYKYAKGQF